MMKSAQDRANPRARALITAATLVMLLTLLSKILGFGREAVLAASFGASNATDAFYVASSIPAVLFGVLASLFTTVAIPVFSDYMANKSEQLASLIWTTFHVIVIAATVVSLFGLVAAKSLVLITAPKLALDVATLGTYLTRWLMPVVVLVAVNEWARAVLNANQRFLAPAAVGVPYNLVFILSISIGGLTGNIRWAAWGMVIGLIGQLAIQVPSLVKVLPPYRPVIKLSHPGLIQIGRLIAPATVGAGADQINRIVDRVVASSLPSGSISILNYANRLTGIPEGMLSVPVATVLYPTMAERAAQGDAKGFLNALSRGLTTLAMVTIPTVAGMILVRTDLVRFVYERGEFTGQNTERTAIVFLVYSLGLVFSVGRGFLTRASYALMDSWSPLISGLASVLTNIILNIVLVKPFGVAGVALATSIGTLVGFGVSVWLVSRRTGSIGGLRLLREVGKLLLATAAMATLVVGADWSLFGPVGWQALLRAVTSALGPGGISMFVSLGVKLFVLGITGVITYGAACWLLKVEEFTLVTHAVRIFLPARSARKSMCKASS